MYLATLLLTLTQVTLSQAPAEAAPAKSFPVIEELPDPFQFEDGSRVRTAADWQRRREEMLEVIMRLEYGHVPPAPGNVRVAEEIESKVRFGGAQLFKVLRLSMGPENQISTRVHLYIPQTGEAPYPVIVRFGIDGNCAQAMNDRGYAYACFENTELDPDTEGYDEPGPAQKLYPDHDWASIAVWAWGASRVLDYLETLPEIDTKRSVITGHSRTGKTALLAGVLDERFALVVPNGSGCGGAACFRDPPDDVETLRLITLASRFKSWFQKDFGRFGDKEERLPFDQHFMRALVAPRVVLSTDALGDTWANPVGTQRAWMASQPVFDFLGVSENNLCHFRPGGHDQLPEDFAVLLDVADRCFKGKPLTRDFSTLPEPELKPQWSWKAPEPAQ